VIWGMPAVNFDLLQQATVKAGGADNQIVYWSRLPSWNQTLTPNPDRRTAKRRPMTGST